jgi:hypothetical protein
LACVHSQGNMNERPTSERLQELFITHFESFCCDTPAHSSERAQAKVGVRKGSSPARPTQQHLGFSIALGKMQNAPPPYGLRMLSHCAGGWALAYRHVTLALPFHLSQDSNPFISISYLRLNGGLRHPYRKLESVIRNPTGRFYFCPKPCSLSVVEASRRVWPRKPGLWNGRSWDRR